MKINSTNEYQAKFPDFLLQKLEDFYANRLGREWDGKHILRGDFPKANSINLISNDYLRLSEEPHVLNSQISVSGEMFQAPLMSAAFIHGDAPQSKLERRLASFFDSESAILCQSGYTANVGLLQTLTENTEIPVYIDKRAHMSIWNGISLGNGKAVPFFHNDTKDLEDKIKLYGSGIIVVDSVYSTDGNVAPLCELADLTKKHNCTLIVDESHSFGTHGPDGKGLVSELGINEVVLFRTASLAKTFASRAGLILCPKEFGDFFSITSKPQIFSSALMPFDIAGINAILDLVKSEMGSTRRANLNRNSIYFKSLLQEFGIDVSDSKSQIIGLKIKTESEMLHLKEALEEYGIYGAPFCSPATPKKKPLLRISLHSELQLEELSYIAESCKKCFSVLNL